MRPGVMRVLLAYQPVALIVSSLLSQAPAASASVALVVVYVVSLIAGWWLGLLAAALTSSLVLPVLLWPHIGFWSVFLMFPTLAAVARALTGLAPTLMSTAAPARRTPSPLAQSLGMVLGAVMLLGVVPSSTVLALSAGIVLLLAAVMLLFEFVRLGPESLVAEQQELSARAGECVDIAVRFRSARRHARGYVYLSGEGDVNVRTPGPSSLQDGGGKALASLTPALGGPASVTLWASVADTLGLVHAGQRLTIAELNVIPRARVARWVVEEFLEHRGGGVGMRALSGEAAGFVASQGGVEYVSSHAYAPGDSLQSIDWKHTARLQHLVVKSFDDSAKSPGVLLVNLSVMNADEADRLVYEFLSAALTVASISQSAAVAVYNQLGDHRLSPALDGRLLVRRALEDSARVHSAPAWRRESRALSAQDMEARLARVRRARGAVAPRLAVLLDLKERSLKADIEGTPVGALFREAARRVEPAWCVAISPMHRDAEAVLTGLRWMERQGIRTKLVNVGAGGRRAVQSVVA